ncbi:putative damage-inducible protein DinB [Bacillus pakistanensis]|uniref:Damage-inducible protein DinB n=1 Tax=Rossellomorea pakistanensis TaxID=992288 RepID=A0ABS2NBZ2_9BACI|nr:DinB family protein [Bacillus pakistanensis]MBM7585330.1 putative damage-inducible protein DinB [Bacillus pakistanensis]
MEQYLEHNKRIRAELLNSVNTLSDEQLNRKVEEDSWTVMQILHHLYLMEGSIAKTIQSTLEKGEKQTVDSKPIELTVNRSKKVEAPSFVEPSLEFITLEEIKEKLKQSRNALLQVVSSSNSEELKKKAFPHPVFGLVSLEQWVPFIGYHEKRHLEQMEELKAKL